MKDTLIGTIVGITIAVGAFAIYDRIDFGGKWMKGSDLITAKDRDTDEGKAIVASFDKDNGKVYCVPKMKGQELGEFKASLPGLIIKEAFGSALTGDFKDFNEKRPMESALRMVLTKHYPCK